MKYLKLVAKSKTGMKTSTHVNEKQTTVWFKKSLIFREKFKVFSYRVSFLNQTLKILNILVKIICNVHIGIKILIGSKTIGAGKSLSFVLLICLKSLAHVIFMLQTSQNFCGIFYSSKAPRITVTFFTQECN